VSEAVSERVPADRPKSTTPTTTQRAPRLAVVLAAGRSERMSELTGGGSKALIRVGGLSLVERAVRTLLSIGIEHVIVVVGYQAGPVAAVANRVAPGRVRAAFAEEWSLGNGASLAAAEPHVAEEDLFLLVTTDHIFDDGALPSLLAAGRPGVLVDHAPEPDAWAEGTRVRLREEQAVAFSKELDDPSIDCGAFLLPRAVFDAQRRAAERGDGSLAGAVTELARREPLEAVPLAHGTWWQDVDTPEDRARASARLRRSLTKRTDGPISRYLNRPLSTRLSMALAHLPLHPDVLSVIAFLVGLAGAWVLGTGSGILGGLLVHASSLLDGVDGEIARLRVRARPGGALLDGFLDRLADAAILAGVAVWALAEGADPTTVVLLAVAATAGAMLSMATKDRTAALGLAPPPERFIGFLLGGRDGRLFLVTVLSLFGLPVAALVAVAVTSGLSLFVRLLLTRAEIKSPWPGAG